MLNRSKFQVIFPALAFFTAGSVWGRVDSPLDTYVSQLQSAKSLKVALKVVQEGGDPVKGSLAYSSPNRFRIDLGDLLVVSDGTTRWALNKAANTYTEDPASIAPTHGDEVWAWSGFFNAKPFAEATDISDGGTKKIAGASLQEWKVAFKNDRLATILLSATDGLAHGATIRDHGKTTIVLASEVVLGTTTLPDSTFAFTPPDGAKKIEKPKIVPGSYLAVNTIFQQHCTGCHGANGSAGLDLSSYDSVMAGGRGGKEVVAGSPDTSPLYNYVTGATTPRMPLRADPLTAEDQKSIRDWIASGAKKE